MLINSKNKQQIVLVKIFFMVLLSSAMSVLLFLISYNLDTSKSETTSILSILSIFLLGVCLVNIKLTGKSLLSPIVLFYISLYVFTFGQALLYAVDIDVYLWVFRESDTSTLNEALRYSLVSYSLFHLGVTVSDSIKSRSNRKEQSLNQQISYLFIGKALFFLSFPVTFYFLILQAITSLQYGYLSLYSYESASLITVPSIYNYIAPMFQVACLMLIINYHYNNQYKMRNKYTVFLLLFATLNVLTGSRTTFLSIILTLISIYSLHFTKFSIRKSFFVVSILGILVLLVPFFSYFRIQETKSIEAIIKSIEYATKENPIVTTMNELGGSLNPQILVRTLIPSQEFFKLGKSYLSSVFLLVPNIFSSFGVVHFASNDANLSQWLMSSLNLSIGPGFSMFAETYYNFGEFGMFLGIVWGFILERLLDVRQGTKMVKTLYVPYASIMLFFTLPRNQSVDFIRPLVFYIVIPLLLVKFFRKNSLKKGVSSN